MTDQEILEKAIQKAIDGGWQDPFGIKQFSMLHGVDDYQWSTSAHHLMVRLPRGDRTMQDEYYPIEQVIFNHDFARSLFGEIEWKEHLREMVVSNEPIRYLEHHV